jgi:hypothetical protein
MRIDLPGVACFSSALFLVTLALIEGNHRGWTNPWILSEGAGALVLFFLFIGIERNQTRRMLDLSYFGKPTYLGANLAQLSFAVGMLTMLTFIPMFLQSGLGHPSAAAGLMMLPMVVPVFIVPRIVDRHLAHRFSGRDLLTAGLFLVSLGLFWLAFVVREADYGPLIGGMLLAGIGAGFLNGETTKVGMTVIPRERSGMASGVATTVRFGGLVIGIAALGAVLYGRVAFTVADALPHASAGDRLALVHDITTGKLSGNGIAGDAPSRIEKLAVASFANGYHALFLTGALVMLVSTILTWRLVSPAETQPVSRLCRSAHQSQRPAE